MSGYTEEAALILAPSSIAVISVGATSGETNLTSRTELSNIERGHFISLIADADCWINFGAASSGSVSKSATSGATQGWFLPGGVLQSFVIVDGNVFLRHIADASTLLRVYVSSRLPTGA
jgi:hypothetical protein